MRATIRVLASLVLLLAPATAARTQTFTGGIRGVITDANGVVPSVTVTLTNEATNVSRNTR
ncbi:MAG: hypothetical protein LC753_12715 [Acidobacteria bacterium]|nr:hypothetical protein [Acidobacteriota bacterium]